MREKAQLYIARMHGDADGKVVRIDARKGPKLLGRIELTLEDFAAAVMGSGAIPCIFTDERDKPGQRDALRGDGQSVT